MSFGLLALMAFLYWQIGALSPEALPQYANTPRQILGMALMLTLLPAYIPLAAWLGQRRSLALAEELRPQLPDPSAADAVHEAVRSGLRRHWAKALALGIAMGLLNTNPLEALRDPAPGLAIALSLGQMVLWSLVGLLFAVRVPVSSAFRRLAEVVPLDVLRPEQQKPISQAGLTDIAIIAGALLLTPLQSLDAEFRWFNYQFGLLIALPSAAFLLLWPLQPIHRRNRADRDRRLVAIDRQLAELAGVPPATPEASARLETLLAHRDRLRAVRTWPLSTGLISRVLLYLVIPPLAWAGAAVVERMVDRFLG